MPQHKLKAKAKLPSFQSKVKKNAGKSQKKNRPVQPKKSKITNQLRHEITKAINTTNEETAKERSTADGGTFRVLPTPKNVTSNTKSSKSKKPKK